MKDLSEYLGDTACGGAVQVQKSGSEYLYTPYLNCGENYATVELYKKVLSDNSIVTSGYGLYNMDYAKVFRGEDVNNFVKLENEKYSGLKKVHDSVIEEGVEAEFSLPEYMPEILRILKSQAVPKINSWQTVGERVTVDGTCELTMIYIGSDNCIYSFTGSRNFTRYAENPAFLTAEDVNVKAGVKFINCRATNTKRAEIKGGINISVSAFSKAEEDILLLESCSNIQEKNM